MVKSARILALAGLVALAISGPCYAQDDGFGGLGGPPALSEYAQRLEASASGTPMEASPQASVETTEKTQAVGPAISVVGSPAFVEETMKSFDVLRATSVGRQIIENIEATGNTVTITETTDDNGYARAANSLDLAWRNEDGSAGPGDGGEIEFNPYREGPAATLGHELLHTMHIAMGILEPGRVEEGPNAGSRWAEMQAIGLEKFKDDPLTENKLRDEINALDGELRQEQLFQQRDSHRTKPPMVERDAEGTDGEQDQGPAPARAAKGAAGRLGELFGGR